MPFSTYLPEDIGIKQLSEAWVEGDKDYTLYLLTSGKLLVEIGDRRKGHEGRDVPGDIITEIRRISMPMRSYRYRGLGTCATVYDNFVNIEPEPTLRIAVYVTGGGLIQVTENDHSKIVTVERITRSKVFQT